MPPLPQLHEYRTIDSTSGSLVTAHKPPKMSEVDGVGTLREDGQSIARRNGMVDRASNKLANDARVEMKCSEGEELLHSGVGVQPSLCVPVSRRVFLSYCIELCSSKNVGGSDVEYSTLKQVT